LKMLKWEFISIVQVFWAVQPVTDWTTAITIILTALGVILTALAVLIAVLAWWGYSGIKEEAKKTAEKAIAEYLERQGVKDKIREEVLPLSRAERGDGMKAIPYTGEEDQGNASIHNKSK